MSKNILFVVEGGRSEPRLLRRLVKVMRTFENYEIFSYNTNIHKMLEGMFVGDEIDSDLDFLEYLRSCKCDEEEKKTLGRSFSDIFLIFDLDPQDQKYNPDRLKKAAEFFNDSTENGKLYINYPMLESYRHIPNLDDLSYLDIRIRKEDICRYKEIASKEGTSQLSDISKIDESMMLRMIILNLMKANMIISGDRCVPDPESYTGDITQSALLSKEYEAYLTEDGLFVLNTCLFNPVDYNTTRFFSMLDENKLL